MILPNLSISVHEIREKSKSAAELGVMLHELWGQERGLWSIREIYDEAIRQQLLTDTSQEVYADWFYKLHGSK